MTAPCLYAAARWIVLHYSRHAMLPTSGAVGGASEVRVRLGVLLGARRSQLGCANLGVRVRRGVACLMPAPVCQAVFCAGPRRRDLVHQRGILAVARHAPAHPQRCRGAARTPTASPNVARDASSWGRCKAWTRTPPGLVSRHGRCCGSAAR
jgi:hypothetical protein